jgi:predicted hotdog family 3-hydroxylacyl-ACP dehydratase
MEATDILQFLPQRPPFVMVDRLLQADEEVSRSEFTVREDNLLVEDGRLSASGLVENIAQTAGAGTGYKYHAAGKPTPMGFIGALKNLNVFELPKLGDTITTEIRFVTSVMSMHLVQGKIILENREIANCELKIFLQG